MELSSPLHVPNEHNHLYCKPSHLENPSKHGERVQYEKKEFTAWLNDYLQHVPDCKCITDLQEDLADGITLLYFVQQISYESPPCVHQNPALYVHRVENTEECLLFLDRLGVDLRGVYAEDVVSGNIKTILALCRAMQIRFQGDMSEDHRCLSPVLSWKHKSLSPSLSSAGFTWPKNSFLQEGEQTSSHQDETAACSETSSSSIFTVWYKEDMAVFSWIKRLLGIELKDYSEFGDGILLCAIVNQLWDESVTQEEVLYSTPLERLEIATEAAEQFLGVPRNELDLKAVIDGQSKDGLTWYLLDLKAASEQMMTQYLAMGEERDRMKNEEEAVNQMRRQLIRQYSRDNIDPVPPVDLSGRNQTIRQSSQDNTDPIPTIDSSDRNPTNQQARGPTDTRLNDNFQRDPSKSCLTSGKRISDQGRTEPESISDEKSSDKRSPAVPYQAIRELLGFDESTDAPERPIVQGETHQEMEELETSLSLLMKPTTRLSSLLGPKSRDAEIDDNTPLLQQTSSHPLDASPAKVALLPRDTPSRMRNQPDVSGFFSPFSMPFLSTASRTDARTRIGNSMRNTSSRVEDDDNLARDKLTTWNDKDVLRNQGHDSLLKEPGQLQKPRTRKLSATMMARLAARSPGGVAGMNASDSDD
ncbi:uncharacterized protein LOC117297514 [Asterias rubens]|uniref:uncharacterized protein LOC117297514 n=1 Tax=Asterias rubens TaxID=7604 RepID=UPI0014553EAA|nr:uncharacterized protein LOC117297514 [Asterias rubens]